MQLCRQKDCVICFTANTGVDKYSCKYHKSFARFKNKFILDYYSSSADKHTKENEIGNKAILLCDVLPGCKYSKQAQDEITEIPKGYDSMSCVCDDDLSAPIIIISNCEAILPRFIIIYKNSTKEN